MEQMSFSAVCPTNFTARRSYNYKNTYNLYVCIQHICTHTRSHAPSITEQIFCCFFYVYLFLSLEVFLFNYVILSVNLYVLSRNFEPADSAEWSYYWILRTIEFKYYWEVKRLDLNRRSIWTTVFCTYYRELRVIECTYYREMTVATLC